MKSYFIVYENRLCIFTPIKWRPYDEIIKQKVVSGWVHIETVPVTFGYICVSGSDVISTEKDIDIGQLI